MFLGFYGYRISFMLIRLFQTTQTTINRWSPEMKKNEETSMTIDISNSFILSGLGHVCVIYPHELTSEESYEKPINAKGSKLIA